MSLECEKGRSFPSVFEDIIETLEKHFGLDTEGIFRQCGKSLEVLNFKKLYNGNNNNKLIFIPINPPLFNRKPSQRKEN